MQLCVFLSADNASRFCHANGTWSLYTNYSACRDITNATALETGIEVTTTLYYVGYTLSLVALILAVSVFLYFK